MFEKPEDAFATLLVELSFFGSPTAAKGELHVRSSHGPVILGILLGLLGVGLVTVNGHDQRRLSETADRVAAGEPLTDSQLFERYVMFAYRDLKPTTWRGLPNEAVRLYYWLNPMHPSAGDVLRWGADYRGPCGSLSCVVVAMLGSRGIPARPLLLLDAHGESIHTVVEARVDGRWVVGDPSMGVVFKDCAGGLVTSDQLAGDRALLRANIAGRKDYPTAYDYGSVTRFNWRKIPVVLPAVRALLVATIGEQRVRQMVRPELWMHSQLVYGVLLLLLSILSAGLGLRSRRALAWRASSPARPRDSGGRAAPLQRHEGVAAGASDVEMQA